MSIGGGRITKICRRWIAVLFFLSSGCNNPAPSSLAITTGPPVPSEAVKLLASLPNATLELELWIDEAVEPVVVKPASVDELSDTVNAFRVVLPAGRHTLRLEEFINDPIFGRVRIAITDSSDFLIEANAALDFSTVHLLQPFPDDDRDGAPNIQELWARTRPDRAEDVPRLPGAAQLRTLSMEGATFTPEFDPSRSYFTGRVMPDAIDVVVIAQPHSAEAVLIINEVTVGAGEKHHVVLPDRGNTTIRVAVVAANGDRAVYYIVLVRDEMSVTVEPWHNSARLYWRGNATSYNVYQSATPQCDARNYASCDQGKLVVNAISPYTATGLTNGTRYYFYVESIYPDGVRVLSEPLHAKPDPVVLNCCVKALTVTDDGTAYVGGSFTRAGVRTGHGVMLNAQGVEPVLEFDRVNGVINAVVEDGRGGWYIGGAFTRVGTAVRYYLAHILPSGGVDLEWDANIERIDGDLPGGNAPTPAVTALALSDTALYFSGTFVKVSGEPREGMAAVDHRGTLLSWKPETFNSGVATLALDNGTVFVGGSFRQVGSTPRTSLAAVDAESGALLPWAPDMAGNVYALAVTSGRLFVGGAFSAVNGTTRKGLAAFELAGKTVSDWDPQLSAGPMADLSVDALVVGSSELYIAGSFGYVRGQPRNNAAAVALTDDAAPRPWNPDIKGKVQALATAEGHVFLGGAFTQIGATACARFAVVDAVTGGNPRGCSIAPEAAVRDVAVSANAVYIGGEFLFLGGRARSYLAAIDANGAVTDWAPMVDGPSVIAITPVQDNIIVGGSFGSIDGVARRGVAAIHADGSLSPWNPTGVEAVQSMAAVGRTILIGNGGALSAVTLDGDEDPQWNHQFIPDQISAGGHYVVNILAIAASVDQQQVYVGGRFTGVDNSGVVGRHIAAFDRTGALLPWPVNVQGLGGYTYVNALSVVPTGVFLSGYFQSVNDSLRHSFAVVDPTSGEVLPLNTFASSAVNALAAWGSHVYLGGWFTQIAGESRRGLGLLSLYSADGKPLSWRHDTNGPVRALTVWGDFVFAGGDFSAVNDEISGSFVKVARFRLP